MGDNGKQGIEMIKYHAELKGTPRAVRIMVFSSLITSFFIAILLFFVYPISIALIVFPIFALLRTTYICEESADNIIVQITESHLNFVRSEDGKSIVSIPLADIRSIKSSGMIITKQGTVIDISLYSYFNYKNVIVQIEQAILEIQAR